MVCASGVVTYELVWPYEQGRHEWIGSGVITLLRSLDGGIGKRICMQTFCILNIRNINESLDGRVWNSLISKNLAHYSLSLKCLLIL